MDLGTKHTHALHIRVLPLHIGLTHIDLALHIEQRAHRSRSHAMLSGSRLGDDTSLAHLARHEDLTHGVVDLVGTRVVEVLPLEIELTAILFAHATGIIKG